jgi:uncharacterized SAM-dependent methyltransferase
MGRIEMQLESCCHQVVAIEGEQVHFAKGEVVTTEYSYKYRVEAFHALCASAGWQAARTWTDENQWFSLHYLRRTKSGRRTRPQ